LWEFLENLIGKNCWNVDRICGLTRLPKIRSVAAP
jgi:hypothetical protein